MRRRNAILGAIGVVVAGIAIWYRVAVWPWVVAPDQAEVERAWANVERAMAEGPHVRKDDDDAFWMFNSRTLGAREELARLQRLGDDRNDDTLPQEVHDALEALDAWAKTIGNEDPGPFQCDRERSGGYLFASLSDVVLAAHPDEARIVSFVKLSERLRRRGTFISYAIGLRVLDDAMKAAKDDWPTALRETRADTKELRAAIARDAACIDALFDDGASSSFGWMQGDIAPWYARAFVRPKRERAMVRLHRGERLERCEREISDPTKYLACFGEPGTMDTLPKSIGVRITFMVYAADRLAPVLTRYREHSAR